MLIETLILAIITGYIAGGRIKYLSKIPLRGDFLIFGGLLLRYVPAIFKLPFLKMYMNKIEFLAPYLFLASFLLLAIGVALNIRWWEMAVIQAGIIMNFTVVAANQGFMPVSSKALLWAGFDIGKVTSAKLDMNHILITAQTKLVFLSDIIPVLKPYPMPQVISIGDIFMCLGLFFFIVIKMYSFKTP